MTITEEFENSLSHACAQYKPRDILAVNEFRVESPELWSFIPKPLADESWAVGGVIVATDRQNEEITHAGEISLYDPDDGRIYFEAADWSMTDELLGRLKFQYRPFDYSSVLVGAYDRLKRHPAVSLQRVLSSACGIFQATGSINHKQQLCDGKNTVNHIWQLPWSLIWGPPGTGKTETVARALVSFVAKGQAGKVLVVAPTNIAADQIALRVCRYLSKFNLLMKEGDCQVYRGGRGAGKELSEEYPECLRNRAYSQQYDLLLQEIKELEARRKEALHCRDYKEAAKLTREIAGKRGCLPDETRFVIENEKSHVKVVVLTTYRACTFSGEGDDPAHFDKVIIDEAGMVSRVTCAIVSTLGKTVMLAGDPKQIGPICVAPAGVSKEVRKWLMMSGLSHLDSALDSMKDDRVLFLDEQHRMHPAISRAVSEFTYDGLLRDACEVKIRCDDNLIVKNLPENRAVYWVVDDVLNNAEETCPATAQSGRGWRREASAILAVNAAKAAARSGKTVFVLTPYRAQVREIKKLLRQYEPQKDISVGTIHRHQGAERDVVIVDLVRGALSWSEAEIAMLLNVAMSRARQYFVMISSRAELNTPVVRRLSKYLTQEDVPVGMCEGLNAQQVFMLAENSAIYENDQSMTVKTFGDEINLLRRRMPLYSVNQMRIMSRNIGDGHWLVRGVAGSGKTLILANWAVRSLIRHPKTKILITYYNKGMRNLIRAVLGETCQRIGYKESLVAESVDMMHVDMIVRDDRTPCKYDAIFIDEAQDIALEQLETLYGLCKEQQIKDGNSLRNMLLFYDDAQNIYGRRTIEELKDRLPGKLNFQGRSIVLREAYRSTQAILGFALNMALDPKKKLFEHNPGLLEYFKIAELANEGLIERPEEAADGLYHIGYTESPGVAPYILQGDSATNVFDKIAAEIKRLVKEENVSYGDILVITTFRPNRAKNAIRIKGISAEAYARNGGVPPSEMPARDISHVRCTTIFSCKGHEAPVVFFANVQEIDRIPQLNIVKSMTPEAQRRVQRCMLYVGFSRAMLRLYVCGTNSPVLDAAKTYSNCEPISPGLL